MDTLNRWGTVTTSQEIKLSTIAGTESNRPVGRAPAVPTSVTPESPKGPDTVSLLEKCVEIS